MSFDGENSVGVVVVDDSALMRELVCRQLRVFKDIDVLASCASCEEAQNAIEKYRPDVVTLDVEMPGMDGLKFLKKIMQHRPMPVIMVSTLTRNGADISLRALELGAIDVIEKPTGRVEMELFSRHLVDKIRNSKGLKVEKFSLLNQKEKRCSDSNSMVPISSLSSLVAIGSSTGGVAALQEILAPLPKMFPPIVVTQHMPANFILRFVSRLGELLDREVSIAVDGAQIVAGGLYFAPGDAHMTVISRQGKLYAKLLRTEPVSGHIPSVDVMFDSIARNVGEKAVGIILTGMGRDGSVGLRSMKNRGSLCLGQSKSSCVVYGMPRAAREIGAVHEELSLEKIPNRVCQFFNDCSGISYKSSIGAN